MKKILLCIIMLMLSTSVLAKTINLAWDESPSAAEGKLTGYEVCVATSSGILQEGVKLPTEGILPTCTDAGNVLVYTYTDLPDSADHYISVVSYYDNPLFPSELTRQRSVQSNVVLYPGLYSPAPPSNNRGTQTLQGIVIPGNL